MIFWMRKDCFVSLSNEWLWKCLMKRLFVQHVLQCIWEKRRTVRTFLVLIRLYGFLNFLDFLEHQVWDQIAWEHKLTHFIIVARIWLLAFKVTFTRLAIPFTWFTIRLIRVRWFYIFLWRLRVINLLFRLFMVLITCLHHLHDLFISLLVCIISRHYLFLVLFFLDLFFETLQSLLYFAHQSFKTYLVSNFLIQSVKKWKRDRGLVIWLTWVHGNGFLTNNRRFNSERINDFVYHGMRIIFRNEWLSKGIEVICGWRLIRNQRGLVIERAESPLIVWESVNFDNIRSSRF